MFRGITKGEWIISASLISCCVLLILGARFSNTQNSAKAFQAKPPQQVQPAIITQAAESVLVEESIQSSEPAENIEPSGFTNGILDLNLATLTDLETLPNIGPKKAEAILEFRNRIGGFASIQELTLVSGIGEKTLESLSPMLTVTSPRQVPIPDSGVEQTWTPQTESIININTATIEQLMELKGIGEVTARKIVLDRQLNGPYRSISDLQRVRGIGPATVQNNAHRLRL